MEDKILTKGEMNDFIIMWNCNLHILHEYLDMSEKDFITWVLNYLSFSEEKIRGWMLNA